MGGSKKMKIIAIKTDKGFYISDNVEYKEYFDSKLKSSNLNFKFDVDIEPTYHKDWFFCKVLPLELRQLQPRNKINQRWELKEGYPTSELLPVKFDYRPEENIAGLYSYKYDLAEAEYLKVDLEIEIAFEINDFEIKQISEKVSHNLIDVITTPSILLVTKPTKIDYKESFRLIRQFVKTNCNLNYARIYSDYDFSFVVLKRIEHKPEPYQKNMGTLKRPKYITDYRRNRDIRILDIGIGNSYKPAPEFEGKNYDECKEKLNDYLEKLKIEIEVPLKECPHCNGLGVLLKEDEK